MNYLYLFILVGGPLVIQMGSMIFLYHPWIL